jgi:hypothetical protein
MRCYLAVAATAFAVYAIAAGLLAPTAPFPVVSFLNAEAFRRAIGIPVEAGGSAARVTSAWKAAWVSSSVMGGPSARGSPSR